MSTVLGLEMAEVFFDFNSDSLHYVLSPKEQDIKFILSLNKMTKNHL